MPSSYPQTVIRKHFGRHFGILTLAFASPHFWLPTTPCGEARMHSNRTFTMAATFLLLATVACAGDTVVDNARGFTLTVPDGFVRDPELVGFTAHTVYGFVLGDPDDHDLDIFLLIEQMRGTIGREPIKLEHMPPGFQGRLFKTQWQGFDVDAFAVPEQFDDIEFITYNVQIPLKHAAIQIKLAGALDRDAELQTLLTEILAGLKGESNWIQSVMPSSPVTSSESYGAILLASAIVLLLGGLVVLWFVSRNSPKGIALLLAAGIYCAGLSLADTRLREVVMLSGSLKMLGTIGVVLGLVDLVRKRKPQGKSPQSPYG